MNELYYLQAIDFEVSPGLCALSKVHAGICPISDPQRWDFVDISQPMTDESIIEACDVAYHELGFRGWVLWHFYNDPILSLPRLEKLIPRLKERVPEARTGLFTAGEPMPKDLSRLLVFDKIWLRNYRGNDTSEIQKVHPLVLVDSAPVLDARMTTPPKLNNQKRCRRMWDEMIFDYYGNSHICTGDWQGHVKIGNLADTPFRTIVDQYMEIRDAIAQEPMAPGAPAFCQNCNLSMRDGNCIIDFPIFREITSYRGF